MGIICFRVGVKKPDERERDVRRYLGWLKESARQCSEDTDKILRCHACFAGLMVLQIDGASTSRPKGLDPSIGPSGLATVIATASRSLSQNVVKMQSDLESFVSYLKKMQVKKKSMARRILGWLKLLFDALAVIFPLGSSVAPLFHSVPPALHVISPVASAFFIAAAKLSEKAAGTFLGMPIRINERSTFSDVEQLKPKDPEKLESVLRFLKNTVPKEAREAQQTLALSDAALVSMGLEEHMTTGRLLALPRLDSAAIAQEWRDVAERYLSELPETRNRSSQRDE